MSAVGFDEVTKVYTDGTEAVQAISLDIEDGEFVVIVGPSGCGKSTLLRMLAGLESIDGGRVLLDGECVSHLPPKRRDVAMVFQNYALYPHMTVRDNIGFALKQRGVAKPEIAAAVAEAARFLELEELLDRKPRHLSGGQRQRVAVGRAIVRKPKALLLDEPLSNLDARLRTQMRSELGRLHQSLGTTTIFVTHDQVEAMTLGDRVAVLSRGRLLQCDQPRTLYKEPANLFVAGFIGSPTMNFAEAVVVDSEGLALRLGDSTSVFIGGTSLEPVIRRHGCERVVIGFRPESVSFRPHDGASSVQLESEVAFVEHVEPEAFVDLLVSDSTVQIRRAAEFEGVSERVDAVLGAQKLITARINSTSAPSPGEVASVYIDASELHLFDPETTMAMR